MEDKEVIELLKDAFELKRQGKYKRVIELLYKALTICPDDLEILMQVADMHILLNNAPSACAILERLSENAPDNISVFEKLVSFYIDNFNFDKAKILLEKFILAYPSELAYCVYLEQYIKIKDYDKVVEFYEEKNLDTFNSYKLNKFYGIALCRQKKYEQAKSILVNIQESGHADEELLFYLAQTLYFLNDKMNAYEIAINLSKKIEDARVYNLCGEIELGLLKYERAIDFFSMAIKLKNDGLYLYNLATAYFLNGQINEAKIFYTKAVSVAGEVKEYKYALAYLHYTIKEYNKAKHIVDALLKLYPDFREAVLLNINLLFDENQYCQAEKEFQTCEYVGKEHDTEALDLGVKIYKALFKKDKAEALLNQLIKLKPTSVDYMYDLAELYFDEQKYDDALTIALRLIFEHSNYVNAYILAAKIYQKIGNYDKAVIMADKALMLDLNSEEALYYKAMAKAGLKEFDAAVLILKTLLNYNPNRVEAYAFLGVCYTALGEYETAKKYYIEAISFEPGNADYFINIAMLEQQLNDRNASIKYLYVAYVLQPENKDILEKLIDAYVETKHYKQAIKLLKEQFNKTKELELKKEIETKIFETEVMYKKSTNPLKYIFWKFFKL